MAKNIEKVVKVPNLRFPEFEGEWKSHKLGDLMDSKVTNSYSRDMLNYEKGKVKNIHYGDIHTKFQTLFDITKEKAPYINEGISLSKILEDFYCKEGDIIFADASEDLNDVGKSIEIVNLDNQILLSGLHTLLVRPKKGNFYIGFNGYLLKSRKIRLQIQKEAQGSKVLSISNKRIANVKLIFPSIYEQEKITNLLSLVDKRIQSQSQIIEKYQSLIKGFRDEVFKQKLEFNSKKKLDWKKMKLSEFCKFYSGGTPKSTNKSYYSGNISDDSVNNYITEEALKSSSAKLVKVGDLLYALYGATSGEIAISKISGAINQAVLCIRTNENKYYLYHLLKHNKDKIVQTYIQGGQGNLSAKIVKELTFNIPTLIEQNKIANFLSVIDEKILTEKKILNSFIEQKKYLLQNLFI